MPAKRLSMRKIREVLRLRSTTQLSQRQIARSVGIASSTVIDYLARLRAAELHWPLADDLSDAEIERLLFVAAPQKQKERPLPKWSQVDQELRRSGVTLLLLWQEYKSQYPDGINYSRFCGRYNLWRGQLDLVMRRHHKAGERLFVDYAGPTMPVTDPATGEIRTAQIFVGVLGASNYTYAEATWTQDLADWIGSHQRTFAFLGGVPEIVVPDNLKSGVTHPHRYDPEINRSYAEMAEHYGVAILPARVRKPRDKAKVEGGVRIVEQSILASLRDRTFFSLQELNQAIIVLLEELNNRDSKSSPARAEGSLRRLTARPWVVCRRNPTAWRSGRRCGSISITTSKSTVTTTVSRSPMSASNSLSG